MGGGGFRRPWVPSAQEILWTVTIPQYQLNKTKQHTLTKSLFELQLHETLKAMEVYDGAGGAFSTAGLQISAREQVLPNVFLTEM